MTRWVYVCANLICSKMASIMPNMAYVVDQPKPGVTVKAGRRGLLNLMDRGFNGSTEIGPSYDYRLKSLNNGSAYDYSHDWREMAKVPYRASAFHPLGPAEGGQEFGFSDGGHSWLTMGEYRSKALSVVKPHEDLEPLETDHPLRRLIENPNPFDTHYDIEYELTMFDILCGVSYEWLVPNDYGMPSERWCIPSHWVWPRTGGGAYLTAEMLERYPHADELVQYYEVRPWGGMGSAGMLKIPPDEIIMRIRKSPLNKIDGYSPLAAMAQWIDLDESISKSRWAQMINQARPELHIELGPGYEDPDDDRISRIEAKLSGRFQGEYNYAKPIVTPPGAKLNQISWPPNSMAYEAAGEQTRDMILSGFNVPPAAVGLSKEMTYGSILATLGALCAFNLNPRLAASGQTGTKHLASRFDERAPAYSTMTGSGHGSRATRRRVRLWYDDCVPADPQQVNSDLAQDLQGYAITPDEIRALRGRKPYPRYGNVPWVNGPGGVTPFPMEGDSLEALAESLAPMAELKQGGKESGPVGAGGASSQPSATPAGPVNRLAGQPPSDEVGGAPETDFTQDVGVAEPNGKPTKSWQEKGYGDEDRLAEFKAVVASLTEQERDGLEVWYHPGPPLLVLIDQMDWHDGSGGKKLKRPASKFTGDEARVIWENEGAKPDKNAGWVDLMEEVSPEQPTKYWANGRSRDRQLTW